MQKKLRRFLLHSVGQVIERVMREKEKGKKE
jgi:hypothetical protein